MRRPGSGTARRTGLRGTGVAASLNTTAPVLATAVVIGNNPAVTAGVWTGTATPLLYTLMRDGVPVSGLTMVTEATIEAYAYVAADIGPSITVREYVVGGEGYADSNAMTFAHATFLSMAAIGVSTSGLTLADSDTTVTDWASAYGGISVTCTEGLRAGYSATGGAGSRPLVTFNGTDQYLVDLTVTLGAAQTSYEMGIVGRVTTSGSSSDTLIDWAVTSDSSDRRLDESGVADKVRLLASTSIANASTNSTTVETTTGHWSGDWAFGAVQNIRYGGTVENSTANDRVNYADGGDVYIGARSAGGFCECEMQAWYVCSAQLTSTQRDHLRALLSYHTGVTC